MSKQIWPRPEGHEGYTIASTLYAQTHIATVKAVCRCGWKSEMFSAAGMAGAAWDEHVLEMTLEK